MKALLLSSAIALGVFGFSNIGNAKGHGDWGDMQPIPMGDKTVHAQFIEDADGGQWVIMSRADAEMMYGKPLGAMKFTKMQ